MRFFNIIIAYNNIVMQVVDGLKKVALCMGQFWPLLNQAVFLEVAKAVFKIGSSLKPNHHREI